MVNRSWPAESKDGAPTTSMSGVPRASPSVSKVGPGDVTAYGVGRAAATATRSVVVVRDTARVIERAVAGGAGS